MFWKRIGALVLMFAVAWTSPAWASPAEPPEAVPSGQGYVLADGWIYYQINEKMFRMREDGSGSQQINEDSFLYLAVDGDTLYYSKEGGADRYSLFRMAGGGGDPEGILKGEWEFFEIVGTDAFLVGHLNNSTRGVFKLDLTKPASDKDALKLYHSKAIVGTFAVHDGWIYYTNYEFLPGQSRRSRGVVLYRMRADGKKRKKLLVKWSRGIKLLAVRDGRIYYNLGWSGWNPAFESIKLDGSDRQLILKDAVALCVDGDAAYFQYAGENPRGLHKTSLDGKQISTVIEHIGELPSCIAAGPWLFYNDPLEITPMMMKRDGTGARVVPGYVRMTYPEEE